MPFITLFKYITMFCGTDNNSQYIPHIFRLNMGIFYGILSVPQNTVMNLNNVMFTKLIDFTLNLILTS